MTSRSSSPKKYIHTRTNTAANISNPITPIRNPIYSHPTFSPDQHISPTKAAAQSRLNHEINTITVWLEGLFAPDAVPAHLMKWRDEVLGTAAFDSGLISNDGLGVPGTAAENGILEVLKGWRQVNVAAEHLDGLVRAARREELLDVQQKNQCAKEQREDGQVGRTLLDEIEDGLDLPGKEALANLTDAAMNVGSSEEAVRASSGVLQDLFTGKFAGLLGQKILLEQQLQKIKGLEAELATARAYQNLGQGRQNGSRDEHERIHVQTAQLSRDAKQVALKNMEHEDRVKVLQRQLAGQRSQSIDIGEMVAVKQRNEEREKRVKALQQQFAAFHGLPADLEASREEVKRSVDELEVLKARRQKLLGRIGNAQ